MNIHIFKLQNDVYLLNPTFQENSPMLMYMQCNVKFSVPKCKGSAILTLQC